MAKRSGSVGVSLVAGILPKNSGSRRRFMFTIDAHCCKLMTCKNGTTSTGG